MTRSDVLQYLLQVGACTRLNLMGRFGHKWGDAMRGLLDLGLVRWDFQESPPVARVVARREYPVYFDGVVLHD